MKSRLEYTKISVGKCSILKLFPHRSPFDSFSSASFDICEKDISEFKKTGSYLSELIQW
jgi:hypothetical protein